MNKLIRFRKRTALRIFIIMIAIVTLGSFIFNGKELFQVARGIRYMGAPRAINQEEFDENLVKKGVSKIPVNFLDDTEITYGTDTKTEYTYALTIFDGKYYVILQEGPTSGMLIFDHGDNNTQDITVSKVSQSHHGTALDMMIENFSEYFEVSESEMEVHFYPEVLRLEGYRDNAKFPLILFGGGIALSIIVFAFLNYKALNDITKELDEYEMNRVDAEAENPLFTAKSLILTRSYLIRTSGLKLKDQLIPIKDIAWLYRQSTTQRVYGIPTGTTHALIIYRRNSKKSVMIPMSEIDFFAFIDAYETLNTDTALGYHDIFVSMWNASANGQAFVDKINALRAQQEAETSATEDETSFDEVVDDAPSHEDTPSSEDNLS